MFSRNCSISWLRQAEAHAQKSSSAPKELDDTEMEPPNKEGSNTAELVLSDSDDDHARKRLLKLKGLSDISGDALFHNFFSKTV